VEISEYIKAVRTVMGETQKDFAKRLGKDRTTITNYEAGRVIPPGDVLLRIQKLDDLTSRINERKAAGA